MYRQKLLVVDEESESGRQLSETLPLEYEVLAAQSGEEAIKKAILERPDCILLEMMMPQMGGFMLCEVLRSLKQTKLTPIILMSAKPREALWPTVQKIGFTEYIEKPFRFDQIAETLSRTLDVSAGGRRRELRIRLRIPLIVCGRDGLGNRFEACVETENISRFGALIQLPVQVPVSKRVEIHRASMPMPKGFAILTEARVARNEPIAAEGPYWHGLEFSHPSSEWVTIQ
jgi:CheY-like chemotaxis protein